MFSQSEPSDRFQQFLASESFRGEIKKLVGQWLNRNRRSWMVNDIGDELAAEIFAFLCETKPATREEAVEKTRKYLDCWRNLAARDDERSTISLDKKLGRDEEGTPLSRFDVIERHDARSRYREPAGETEEAMSELAKNVIAGDIKGLAWAVYVAHVWSGLSYDKIAAYLKITEANARQKVSLINRKFFPKDLSNRSESVKPKKARVYNYEASSRNPDPADTGTRFFPFLEDIGEFQNAAVRQCCVSHPMHKAYLRHAERSRFFQKNPDALLNPDALKNAA